jgi:hypothetical protein
MVKKGLQLDLRGDGKTPVIQIEAKNLAEATHKTIIACHDYGFRKETPKQRYGMTLGYDADITVRVSNPDSEPKVYFPGMYDDGRGVVQYNLELTHGIHNHWTKSPENPEFWGYTYNGRVVDQLPFVFARIKKDWEDKKGEWGNGKGRISGRDYQFGIWKPSDDIILEQQDPACWQRGQISFNLNEKGEIVMNYQTDWRSRDLLKAWNMNNIAQIELMKLMAAKVSDMLGVPIKLGAYIDRASSLHEYGLYVDRDGLEKQISRMKKDGWKKKSMGLDDYFAVSGRDKTGLKRVISAQMIAEQMGHGLNQPISKLEELGFNLDKWTYPAEWDTWAKSWDRKPNPKLLKG